MEIRKILSIWYEFKTWDGPWDPLDCNADIIFQLNDGSRWAVTFFTYQNLETIRKKNQRSGECLEGRYFCADHMVFLEEMTEETVEAVLQEMLLQGEVEQYCQKL